MQYVIIKKKTKIIISDLSQVETLCIDDFAKKKKHSYGTIFINADTNKIINIIDSHEAEDVTSELKKYPNLKIVSRDGSWMYGKAINNYNQNINQVTDRFHLLKNLTAI